jgi:hypothetical protein
VIIADSTRRLLGNLFEPEHLGLQDLKRISNHGPVAKELGSTEAPRRLEMLKSRDQ